MWAGRCVGLGLAIGALSGLTGCGTYEELRPGAESVHAVASRPQGNCMSLGIVVGKGGGEGGDWMSNQALIKYAFNDARNQAAALGATDVVYSVPAMGGTKGTNSSAMVMGEAYKCQAGSAQVASSASPSASAVPNPAATRADAAAPAPASGGCHYDTQCKGDRICSGGECVEPASARTASRESTPMRVFVLRPAPAP